MKMKQIQVGTKFSEPKAKALEYYLQKQGKSIEQELKDYLDQIYREQVPGEVREYVQSQNPDEEAKEEQDSKPARRQSQRHKSEQASTDAPASAPEPVLSM